MRTDEDFLRLEAENRLLRERLNSAPEIAAELKLGLAQLLAPATRQQPEVQIALRLLAYEAGLPRLCDRRECRRQGICHAQDIPPPCQEHWSAELFGRFADMAAGIELSALCQEQEQAGFHAWACEQLGLAPARKAPRKTRSRKAAA